MKKCYLTSILFVFFILIGCQKDDTKSDYEVSGILKSAGKPLDNASVDIDGLEQYKTTTNSEGYFLIENVPAGNHSLNTKKNGTDNSFIQKSYDIELQNNDLNFQSLVLPNPVLIDTIILDSLTNKATIIWNKSQAEDFREYKLYSHTSSGLDETTGHLEHVTIDINDTVKSIQFENLSEKYFRVFVLNEYGQLGGSNIVNISSINRNLIPGGSFENSENLNNWNITGNITIDNINMYAGLGCVLLNSEIDTVDNNLSGTIDRWPVTENEMSITIDLEANRDYTISFWYKLSGFGYMMYPFNFYYYQNNEENISTTIYDYNWVDEWILQSPFGIINDMEWMFYSKTFTSNSDNNAVFYIKTQMDKVWIDNLEIKITE
jgi:hypothetical protein